MTLHGVLITIFSVIFLFGFLRVFVSQKGGINLSNVGINFGGSLQQQNQNTSSHSAEPKKTDWVGITSLIVGILGLLFTLFPSLLPNLLSALKG